MVVEDHPMTRYGIECVIEKKTTLAIIGKDCGDGLIAMQRIIELQPHIVVLDINLPKKNGISIVADSFKMHLDTKFIIFSGNISNWTLAQLLFFDNVYGILHKEYMPSEFDITLEQVIAGHKYYSDKLKSDPKFMANADFSLNQIGGLTKTELKILKLTSQHLRTECIAQKLFNSVKTIKKHKSNIVRKLSLQGANALYEFSLKNASIINSIY